MQNVRRSVTGSRAGIHARILPALALPALVGFSAALEPTAEQSLTIKTMDYAFEMPDRIEAGVVDIKLINGGTQPHHVYLIRLKDGKTAADLLHAAKGGESLPAWAESVGGPNTPGPGGESEAIVKLEPGSYVAVCVIPAGDGMPHAMKGMVKPFTVVGRLGRAVEPKADATVKLTDYDFGFGKPLAAGRQLIRFENLASQDHEMFFAKLAPGKHAADFVAWLGKQQGPPPVVAMGGVTPFAPGRSVTLKYDVTPGSYALYCFVSDAKDGKPHIMHGMMKEIKVEATLASR